MAWARDPKSRALETAWGGCSHALGLALPGTKEGQDSLSQRGLEFSVLGTRHRPNPLEARLWVPTSSLIHPSESSWAAMCWMLSDRHRVPQAQNFQVSSADPVREEEHVYHQTHPGRLARVTLAKWVSQRSSGQWPEDLPKGLCEAKDTVFPSFPSAPTVPAHHVPPMWEVGWGRGQDPGPLEVERERTLGPGVPSCSVSVNDQRQDLILEAGVVVMSHVFDWQTTGNMRAPRLGLWAD